MNAADVADDLEEILHSEDEILTRVNQLAAEIERDYEGKDLVLLGVLGGAAMFTVDLARAMTRHVEIAWMAVRSYGSGTRSSGSVRLLKDLDIDVSGRHVLVVDGVIDTGLTAQWLVSNIGARGVASAHVVTLFRKPKAPPLPDAVKYVGFDVSDGMIVGYGLDYASRYRNLRCCAVLAEHVYRARVA
jgi:hypoxanthine phosphoribosyltransferase